MNRKVIAFSAAVLFVAAIAVNPNPAQAQAVAGEPFVVQLSNSNNVVVDYNQPFSAMIAVGQYDWVNKYITRDHFPIVGQGTVEFEPILVHLGRDASTKQVLRHLDEQGLRPATLPELLTFGSKNPDEQRKYPIVALDSVWICPGGCRVLVYLTSDDRGRGLGLDWCRGDWWIGHSRFLAVPK